VNEPLRILDDHGNERAREALLAEPDELPPSGAEQRLLAKLGIAIAAAGVLGAAEGVAAEGAAGASNSTGVVATMSRAKWFWLSTIAGALSLGGILVTATLVRRPSTASTDRVEGTTAILPAPIEVPLASEPVEPRIVETASSADPMVQQAPKPAPRRASEAANTLDAEIRLLDKARAALVEGQPARALETLGEYDRDFSHGHLRPEAFLIRLDALVHSGEAPAARRLARDYLAAHPASPHALRIRRIVEDPGH
jgi:hypothetical protein